MEISANAKINLTLDILRRREDGYHDLQMVMQSVSLADELTVTPAQGGVGTAVSDLHFPVSYTHLTLPTKRIV